MVKGLDIFAAFFAGDEAHYVLIGGVATQLVLEDAGLPARATNDLYIVLRVEALDKTFGEKLWAFVREGGYEVRQQSDLPRRFYRFAKPASPDFPSMLEFFAREPGHLPLTANSKFTPVPIDEAILSLSAILLDENYYHFLQSHTRQLSGVRIVTEEGLIPLKARAWLDMVARKLERKPIDSKDIKKHRNDVLRLTQLSSEGQRIEAPAAISADIAQFLDAVAGELNNNRCSHWASWSKHQI